MFFSHVTEIRGGFLTMTTGERGVQEVRAPAAISTDWRRIPVLFKDDTTRSKLIRRPGRAFTIETRDLVMNAG